MMWSPKCGELLPLDLLLIIVNRIVRYAMYRAYAYHHACKSSSPASAR